jgi:4-carboxymuconolactone decarboxylase
LQKWMPPGAPVAPLALFRTLAKSRLLSERMRPLGAGLLGKGTLAAADREQLILRTCQRCGSEYEWGVHAAGFARALGLSDGEMRGETLSPWQALLVRAADELHDRSTLADDTFAALAERLSEEQLLELIALVGFYHLISFVANTAQVPLEPWAARF